MPLFVDEDNQPLRFGIVRGIHKTAVTQEILVSALSSAEGSVLRVGVGDIVVDARSTLPREKHGGVVVELHEPKIYMRLADPEKESSFINLYSINYIKDCIRSQTLLDQAPYLLSKDGQPTAKKTTSRNEFTLKDKEILRELLKAAPGDKLRGNEIYQELARKHNNHTWQSWRAHAVKFIIPKLKNLPPANPKAGKTGIPTAPVPAPVSAIRQPQSSNKSSPTLAGRSSAGQSNSSGIGSSSSITQSNKNYEYVGNQPDRNLPWDPWVTTSNKAATNNKRPLTEATNVAKESTETQSSNENGEEEEEESANERLVNKRTKFLGLEVIPETSSLNRKPMGERQISQIPRPQASATKTTSTFTVVKSIARTVVEEASQAATLVPQSLESSQVDGKVESNTSSKSLQSQPTATSQLYPALETQSLFAQAPQALQSSVYMDEDLEPSAALKSHKMKPIMEEVEEEKEEEEEDAGLEAFLESAADATEARKKATLSQKEDGTTPRHRKEAAESMQLNESPMFDPPASFNYATTSHQASPLNRDRFEVNYKRTTKHKENEEVGEKELRGIDKKDLPADEFEMMLSKDWHLWSRQSLSRGTPRKVSTQLPETEEDDLFASFSSPLTAPRVPSKITPKTTPMSNLSQRPLFSQFESTQISSMFGSQVSRKKPTDDLVVADSEDEGDADGDAGAGGDDMQDGRDWEKILPRDGTPTATQAERMASLSPVKSHPQPSQTFVPDFDDEGDDFYKDDAADFINPLGSLGTPGPSHAVVQDSQEPSTFGARFSQDVLDPLPTGTKPMKASEQELGLFEKLRKSLEERSGRSEVEVMKALHMCSGFEKPALALLKANFDTKKLKAKVKPWVFTEEEDEVIRESVDEGELDELIEKKGLKLFTFRKQFLTARDHTKMQLEEEM
ncbi:hypothetical protein HDV05_000255 [Chytridiales sp. JEL 0842]|nr:hypothetical protein HDV05_000255 [Chytridiales sp. JEL 0842]